MKTRENDARGSAMSLLFDSAVSDMAACNDSFDSACVRICYPGTNRKKTKISKEAIEAAIPSLYNCPIVCHYTVEDDSIGGHDVDIKRTPRGVRLINLTEPVGVIPQGAEVFWKTVVTDGMEREYLCANAILWKRSPAYERIKEDGVVAQSMEINIANGQMTDGVLDIQKFTFTALCLLNGEAASPCFENAALEMYSLDAIQDRMAQMMDDFKTEFSTVTTASAVGNTTFSKGGNDHMNIEELMAEYGLTAEDVDFDTEGLSEDELREKFACASKKKKKYDDEGEDAPAPENEPEPNPVNEQKFSLTTAQMSEELNRAVSAPKWVDEKWRESRCRYWMVDYDPNAMELYANDTQNGYLVGIPYAVDGDKVTVAFENAVRKKVSYVDFDEGTAAFSMESLISCVQADVAAQFDAVDAELETLRKFQQDALSEKRSADEKSLFAKFSEQLSGNEMFEALRSDCAKFSLEEIEDKCFSILGRVSSVKEAKFSMDDKTGGTRLPIENGGADENEPYGGIFARYGIGK